MKKKPQIHVGTSGWHYKHWKETFYPKEISSSNYLDYYQKFLNTVEVNNSFYKLPPPETFTNWKKTVPAKFLFSVKASRFITHMKKLKDPEKSFQLFLNNVIFLKEKLGVILFQLPPNWKYNEERLISLLEVLPGELKYTFEFRDATWYNESCYEILRNYNAAFCIYEIEYHMSPILTTADFVYVRLHGPDTKYNGSYSEKVLKDWAFKCIEWKNEGKNVFFYFDNDIGGHAIHNAIKFQELTIELEQL